MSFSKLCTVLPPPPNSQWNCFNLDWRQLGVMLLYILNNKEVIDYTAEPTNLNGCHDFLKMLYEEGKYDSQLYDDWFGGLQNCDMYLINVKFTKPMFSSM